eukprot:TRINITY_DN14901_c0_g1_i1.p1 TRINITY_DN14901_c0_g1~~TRINITY_DN14901_c0_g1_i1.p1  ORF type:complete len:181 (-),score=54.44 TRINITY_DN14901_c0_g1_i1:151-693(-)
MWAKLLLRKEKEVEIIGEEVKEADVEEGRDDVAEIGSLIESVLKEEVDDVIRDTSAGLEPPQLDGIKSAPATSQNKKEDNGTNGDRSIHDDISKQNKNKFWQMSLRALGVASEQQQQLPDEFLASVECQMSGSANAKGVADDNNASLPQRDPAVLNTTERTEMSMPEKKKILLAQITPLT